MENIGYPKIIKLKPTNCVLLHCEGGYLLIDTSFPKHWETFIEELTRLQIKLSQIKYLLLTHHHDDHAGFSAQLKQMTGCRLIIHENAIGALAEGRLKSQNHTLNLRVKITMGLYNKIKKRNFRIPPVLVDNNDLIFHNEQDAGMLEPLGIKGKLLHTPGHSEDSLTLVMADGNAFVGDICMNFLNFCGIHYRPIYLSDQNLVMESWRKIIASGAQTIYPSHGPVFGIGKLIHYWELYKK